MLSAQSGMIWSIEITACIGEEDEDDDDGGFGFGFGVGEGEQQRTLNLRVLGLEGRVGKVFGVEYLDEREMLVVGLMGFTGCISICRS